MISAFLHVSLWRGNFQPGAEIAALIGHADATPVPPSALDMEREKRDAVEGATHLDIHNLRLPINEQTVLLFYGGKVGPAADLFASYPLNTDDRPVIEFGTPRSLHRPVNEGKPHFLQQRFADLVDRLQQQTPPENDPLLAARTPASRKLPLAGSAVHRASIATASPVMMRNGGFIGKASSTTGSSREKRVDSIETGERIPIETKWPGSATTAEQNKRCHGPEQGRRRWFWNCCGVFGTRSRGTEQIQIPLTVDSNRIVKDIGITQAGRKRFETRIIHRIFQSFVKNSVKQQVDVGG